MIPSPAKLESMADFLGMSVEALADTYRDATPSAGAILSAVERAAVFGAARAALAAAEPARNADEPSRFACLLAEESARVVLHDAIPEAARPYTVPGELEGFRITCPPHTNRGGKLTVGRGQSYLKLDWLSVTFPAQNIEEVTALIGAHLGPCEPRATGRNGYRESVAWPSEAFVTWTEGRREAMLSMNGGSLDLVPVAALGKLVEDLSTFGAKGTRVDAALTDCDRIASMSQIHRAAESGKFRGFHLTEPRRPKKLGKLVGDSRTFGVTGRNGSGCYYIVYDKLLETRAKGEPEIDAIRYETRFYIEKAREAFALLVDAARQSADAFRVALGGLVCGSIDFVERDGAHGHVERMGRLSWWKKITDLLGELPVQFDRVVPELPRTLFHMGKQWFGVMHRAIAAYRARDLDFFDHLRSAVERFAVEQPDPKLGPFDLSFHADDVFLFLKEVGKDAMDSLRYCGPDGPGRELRPPVGSPLALG